MNERELLTNITDYIKSVSYKLWRANRRLMNAPDPSETFDFVSYPLLTVDDLEGLRVATWEGVRAVNQLYDNIAWMTAEKKEGRDVEEVEE